MATHSLPAIAMIAEPLYSKICESHPVQIWAAYSTPVSPTHTLQGLTDIASPDCSPHSSILCIEGLHSVLFVA